MDSGTRKVVLADGTELITDEGAGVASNALWCWLHDITIAEAATLFIDKEKTSIIRFVYGEYMDEFKNFTEVLMIGTTDIGVNVQLTGKNTKVRTHIPAGKYAIEK